MDVRSLMRRSAQFNNDRLAVIYHEKRVTFGESWTRSTRVANALLNLGLRPGDCIGVLETNSLQAADFFGGAAIANLVRVPLYPRNARASHVHMLNHTHCRAVVVSAALAHELHDIQAEVPSIEFVLIRDETYETWLADQSTEDPNVAVDPDDYFIIRHTGGTTGPSKGVAYTHRSWLATGRDWFYSFPPIQVGDRCMHAAPISHGSGYFYLPTWLHGGCNVLLDAFDAGDVLETIEREHIAYGFLVPTMLNALIHHPRAYEIDTSSLKCLQIGAAPINDDTALRAHEIFGDVLWQGYGQTEVVPIAMMGPAEWFGDVAGSEPLRSCGKVLPFADIEIRDVETGEPLPIGSDGEIVARCDGQMNGFWNDALATNERVVDGWVRTGDIGRIDHNGYLYVLDRANDMIISGGFNIYPAELENVVASMPGVIEVAAFGIPHDRWGETPCLVCVVTTLGSVTEEDVRERCASELGSYKRPGKVILSTEPLPKSPVGKILRKTLREPFWIGYERRISGT
jgi:acyl-CoA synthetase (AMP-forming)/AMP-acid ligase II